MSAVLTRADSLRSYLTGAASDGGVQTNPSNSLGHYRSATEAISLGMVITSAISGVTVQFAGGANPVGAGTLTAVDANNLTWKPFGAASAGPPTTFSGTGDLEIVEALGAAGQYLRISGTTPFVPGSSTVTLSYVPNNQFGFDNVLAADAAAGISHYRASMVRNEAANQVTVFQRWIALLGTQRTSNSGWLGASGAGSIVTSGSFSDWPASGWCQVRNSGGTLKEVVYYTSRTNTSLTVLAAGRALLGTTSVVGTLTDVVYPVPGIALAIDTAGVQAFGTSIQTIANAITAPTSVTWNLGITASGGLQIGSLNVSEQVGIWEWRQIPPGAISTPAAINKTWDAFTAF